MELLSVFSKVKQAGKSLAVLSNQRRNELLLALADDLIANKHSLLEANEADLALMDQTDSRFDRLMLTEDRLVDIAADMRHVATLPDPIGVVQKHRILENGLDLSRVSVPFGVIGIIYEARPNVTFDVFSLCFKSGNACILKGSKDAEASNQAIVALIQRTLNRFGIDPLVIALLPSTHEATAEMLNAVGFIDLCIPRGGKSLIRFVRDHARVPIIETGAGVVHCYFDEYGNVNIGQAVIKNAKTRRCSVCNALDMLLVNRKRLSDLPQLVAPLSAFEVKLHADPEAIATLQGHYPEQLLIPADENSAGTEWLSMQMGIRTVSDIDEALEHIERYGSGHSETIVTENKAHQDKFLQTVDAACVYVNVPTSFTDGAQFGLGAEIGISTQKLGARGPMALEEMTTYKWIIRGHGQVRP